MLSFLSRRQHAIEAAVDDAVRCREGQCDRVKFSGHSRFDVASTDAYLENNLQDYELPVELVEKALEDLPQFPKK